MVTGFLSVIHCFYRFHFHGVAGGEEACQHAAHDEQDGGHQHDADVDRGNDVQREGVAFLDLG